MRLPFFRRENDIDLERATGIKRNEPPAVSQKMIEELTRKQLGPSWGRKRRQIEGWPRSR